MKSLVEELVQRLSAATYSPDKPDETPETTALALWFAACGDPRAVSRVHADPPMLCDSERRVLEELVARRLNGEPLAYLTGRQEFMGLELLSRPGALIPRRETELLATHAVALTRLLAGRGSPPRVLDLCTGAGNLAVAIAVHEPACRIWASDLHAAALDVAAGNIARHAVGDRVTLLEGDLFGAVRGNAKVTERFDVIVCNPPYIPSHRARNMPVEVGGFEPTGAFDGGAFGVSILFRLVAEAPEFIVPGGWLCFEVGAGQAPGVERRLAHHDAYSSVETLADRDGVSRVLVAQCAH